jgi:phosphatidylglycerol:prolipoprotein diacylglycerol transferase
MFPDLISIGSLAIHTYGVLVATGFAVGILVTIRLGKAQGFNSQQVMDMGFIMILWAIIGSRVTYVLMNFSYYRARPTDIIRIWEGGLVFSGGLIAVVLVMSWYLSRHHISFWKAGDLWAPGIAIGQAIGRLGCFMAGCCYGKPTDMAWGVVFTHPKSLAPLNVSIHPTQLYAALTGLIIFLVLLALRTRKQFDGQLFLWFLILHSTARLLTERFRGDHLGMVPGTHMTVTQLLAILILVASVIILFVRKPKEQGGRP